MARVDLREELLQQIEAAPTEPGPYLVYADWLTQQGDPHGELIAAEAFGAGEGQSLEAPFGHAERRGGQVARLPADLASWAFATASWPNRTEPGGSRGLDDYFTRDFNRNIGSLTPTTAGYENDLTAAVLRPDLTPNARKRWNHINMDRDPYNQFRTYLEALAFA